MRIILFANFEIRKEVILVQTSADEVFCLSSLSQFCLFGKLFWDTYYVQSCIQSML